MANETQISELCRSEVLLFGDEHAYVRNDNNRLSPGHEILKVVAASVSVRSARSAPL